MFQASKTKEVEIITGKKRFIFKGPEAKAFVRSIAEKEGGDETESVGHIFIRASRGGEIGGSLLANGTFLFGNIRFVPTASLLSWTGEPRGEEGPHWPPRWIR